MSYITTNHRFLIDEKHPTDVFEEMENFFSLYTVAIDDLQQVSVQLSVPANFDVNANKSIAEGYRQFTKSLKYTVPDIHILPIKNHQAHSETDEDSAGEEDNNVILLIQRLDGYQLEEDEKPSLYQSVLGKLMPRFSGNKTDTGLYPEREQVTMAIPVAPVPSPVPVPTPVTPTIPVEAPRPPIQPYVPPASVAVPQPQSQQPQSVVTPTPTPNYQPQSVPQPAARPAQNQAQTFSRLPNITKSAKPYQELLTQAIINEATKQATILQDKPISQITLKSSDSLTTAMIEQLFNSFNNSHDKTITAHDALDLVSYGHEVLKPQLAKIGIGLTEDAQFGLKTNYKSTANDIARLQRGEVFSNEIELGVRLKNESTLAPTPVATNTGSTVSTSQPNLPRFALTQPNINQNSQQIALLIKVQDGLGERQQKVSQFPILFVPSQQPSKANTIRIFGLHQSVNELFRMVELDGQVMIDGIEPAITVTRNNQVVTNAAVLMPNDTLLVNGDEVTVQLLLAN